MNATIKDMIERRSIRKFKSDAVPQALIDEVIEAGLYAASGKGKQSPIIVAVTNPDLRAQLSRANCRIGGWKEGFDPFYGAPVILVVLAPKELHTAVSSSAISCSRDMRSDLVRFGSTERRRSSRSLPIRNCWKSSASWGTISVSDTAPLVMRTAVCQSRLYVERTACTTFRKKKIFQSNRMSKKAALSSSRLGPIPHGN